MSSKIYNMTDTWNDNILQYSAIKMNVADINSAINSRLIDLQIEGFSKFAVDKIGKIVIGNMDIPNVNGLEEAIDVLSAAGLGKVDIFAANTAVLNANLSYNANTLALVYGDPVVLNNDFYLKVGGSGTGSWSNTGIIQSLLTQIVPKKDIARTFYVTMSGSDSNNGKSVYKAKATVGAALEAAAADGNPCVVIVHPGEYSVGPNTVVPRNCALYGYDVRVTTLYPSWNQTTSPNNMFLLSSGVKVRGFTFKGLQHEPFTIEGGPPKYGYAFAFKPGEYITRSPYIADSTQIHDFTYEQMSLPIDREAGNPLCPFGGGNLYADGAVLDPDSPLRSVVVDSFTAVNPNGVGYAVVNDALVQLVSIFTNWSRVGVWAHAGGQITTTNSNSTFGDYAFVSTGFRYAVKIDGVANAQNLSVSSNLANYISNNISTIVSSLMTKYEAIDGWTTISSNPTYLTLTARDTTTLLTELADDIKSGKDQGARFFTYGLFTANSIGPSADVRYSIQVEDTAGFDVENFVYSSNTTHSYVANGIVYSVNSNTNTIIVQYSKGTFAVGYNLNENLSPSTNTTILSVATAPTPPDYVFASSLKPYFLYSWDIVRDTLRGITANTQINAGTRANNMINELFSLISNVVSTPETYTIPFESRIEATSQQFSYAGSGINYNALPYGQRATGVAPDPTTNLYSNGGGLIYATFSTERGDTYLGKDLRVDFERSTIEGQAFSRGVQNITLPLIIGVGG